ncbi:hypothetical protein SAMN06265365_104118 [Tistlia consotensis]|uniref:Pycsar effector protein domain-containing protein n=2 Tax=Tistlia TaxID=1321364 RepID=A0A1Y6BVK5_9PROT|nr:hypothetical protein SAMN05428998_107176 [Tistlia consotensis USBA 355]SNR46052.1 hypothetical protein SAMN06265365_104118 [Tistlia consotensis]
MLYLIQPRPTISSGTLQFFHDAFVACCLLAGTLVFLFIGIALCPIPWRGKLPKRGPKGSHSSISHYLDITSFDDGDQYIERLLAIRADDTGPIDGLTREKLRACYEMANIAKDKMSLIARGFGAAAACVLFLLLDLAIFTAHLGQ